MQNSLRNGTKLPIYTVGDLVSCTGMSTVYMGKITQKADNRDYNVIIKMSQGEIRHNQSIEEVRESNNRNARALEDEVALLRVIRHPNIVRPLPVQVTPDKNRIDYTVYWDADNYVNYAALEYIPDGSLKNFINTANLKHFPFLWRVELYYQLLLAVHYLHTTSFKTQGAEYKGCAHMDLKPDNVLFRYPPNPNRRPEIVLIDFGSFCSLQGVDPHKLSLTRRYAPPELLYAMDEQDERVKANRLKQIKPEKVDVWAVGTILYELMTGRPMIEGRTDREVTEGVVGRTFRTSVNESSVDIRIPDDFDEFLAFHFRTEPEKRPSVINLLMALDTMKSLRDPRIADI